MLRIIEALINRGGYISPGSAAGEHSLLVDAASHYYLARFTDLKQLLQMFTIHDNLQVAYQCCSTTLRLILKHRTSLNANGAGLAESPGKNSRDGESLFSPKILDDLIEHLDTALAFLLTEILQTNRVKELQVSNDSSPFVPDHPFASP